jgi:endo-1,4-beta-xylanase
MAFRFAREANPGATLIFNEAEIDRPGARTKFVYDLLREAIERGTPVDGVGMQFHLKATHAPSKEEMLEAIQLLGSLGLGVYITELDVNLFGLRGSREEKWAQQAQIYRDVVEAALESGVCKSITTWGLSDRYSWLLAPEFQFLGGGEAPLPFDDDFHPKPAFFAVLDVLKHAA